MSDNLENHFGHVARHAVAQTLLTGCMSKSLAFVAGVLQGKNGNGCAAALTGSERRIVELGFLTREQSEELFSRCRECRQALNDAASAWKKRDRRELDAKLRQFREAQRRMRREIVAIAD